MYNIPRLKTNTFAEEFYDIGRSLQISLWHEDYLLIFAVCPTLCCVGVLLHQNKTNNSNIKLLQPRGVGGGRGGVIKKQRVLNFLLIMQD